MTGTTTMTDQEHRDIWAGINDLKDKFSDYKLEEQMAHSDLNGKMDRIEGKVDSLVKSLEDPLKVYKSWIGAGNVTSWIFQWSKYGIVIMTALAGFYAGFIHFFSDKAR